MRPKDPRARLLDHLDGLAAYNDKGFIWSRHTPEEVRDHQRQAQLAIDRLILEIGEEAFSPDLLLRLRGGEAATDAFGTVHEQARQELLGSSTGSAAP